MSNGRRCWNLSLVIVLLCGMFLAGGETSVPAQAATSELFFSEYVEGSSFNKALEIYNETGASIDLAAASYNVQMYFNGSSTAGLTVNLSGTVADGDVFVLAHSDADAAILSVADQTGSGGWFNGNDALVLRKGTTVIDVIGQVGYDPGTEWGSGLTSTQDNTLRRKNTVCQGDSNGGDAFDPSVEWDGYAGNTFAGLGVHTAFCAGDVPPHVTSTLPANGDTGVALDANITVDFNEDVTVSAGTFSISCASSGAHTAVLSSGPQSYTLDLDVDFANGEICTVTVLASGVSDNDTDDPPDNMPGDYVWNFTTVTVGDPDACGEVYTPIYTIQGSGTASPYDGLVVSLEGIVVGDFQNTGATLLNGFFVQEPSGDGDTATSDGVFVYAPGAIDVNAGDRVRVKGDVDEYNTLTEIKNLTVLKVCSTGNSVSPTLVDLPETVDGELEQYEGMLVTIPETLTASQNYFQGRYGQITLSAEGRMYNPTNGNGLGDTFDYNARRLLVLDDGSSGQNPDPIPYIGQDNTHRAGDTVAGLTGTIDYGPINSDSTIRDYRLHPTVVPVFTRVNDRTTAPETVGGNVKVASFNVLNYFNGDGQGGGFPTARGADTLEEFDRQRTKIITAVLDMDADVIGFMEMENDGAGPYSAIQDLVNGLNDATAPGTYELISEPDPGSDEIKVSLIYKPEVVTLDSAAVNYQTSTPDYDPLYSRAPLAQTFSLNTTGDKFTVIVNHFKSKRCNSPTGLDQDQGDGQGCWNAKRIAQAQGLLSFVATLKASDPNVIVIGDLNSYGVEDPINTLTTGGLVDEVAAHVPAAERYSYIFDGQAGYLDHALATAELDGRINEVTIWHVNTDEPSVIDYNTEFKPQDLYEPSAYRSSDHDPVVLGLSFAAIPTTVYADPEGLCAGNAPCYASAQTAVDVVPDGGQVYVYGDAYPEALTLSKDVDVTCLENIGLSSFTQSAGTFTAPAGTLTLTGDFASTGGTFDPNDGTLVMAGSGSQTINNAIALHSLTIANSHSSGDGVALGSDVTVDGTLTLADGYLTLGSFHLTLGELAAIGGMPSIESMVVATDSGELRKVTSGAGSFLFPLGDATGVSEYSPAILNFTTGSFAAGAYAALRLVDDKQPNMPPSSGDYLTRYWTVTQNGISGFSCELSFSYSQAGDVVGDEGNILGARHGAPAIPGASGWEFFDPLDVDGDKFELTVSSFSDFTGAASSAPTEVEVIDLSATPLVGAVLLEWNTTPQLNSLSFNIFRATSPDGERIQLNQDLLSALMNGSLAGTAYDFLDATAQPGVGYYYWIELVDGASSESFGPVQATSLYGIYMPVLLK